MRLVSLKKYLGNCAWVCLCRNLSNAQKFENVLPKSLSKANASGRCAIFLCGFKKPPNLTKDSILRHIGGWGFWILLPAIVLVLMIREHTQGTRWRNGVSYFLLRLIKCQSMAFPGKTRLEDTAWVWCLLSLQCLGLEASTDPIRWQSRLSPVVSIEDHHLPYRLEVFTEGAREDPGACSGGADREDAEGHPDFLTSELSGDHCTREREGGAPFLACAATWVRPLENRSSGISPVRWLPLTLWSWAKTGWS